MMGADAPCWLCLTGPNYRDEPYDHHDKTRTHTGGRKPTKCIVTDPHGHKHIVPSLTAAAKTIKSESRDVRNIRSGISARGYYLSKTGWRVELAQNNPPLVEPPTYPPFKASVRPSS